jgi:hypothetical protein
MEDRKEGRKERKWTEFLRPMGLSVPMYSQWESQKDKREIRKGRKIIEKIMAKFSPNLKTINLHM